MNITLQIQNNGIARGTLGWLCANIGSIKIGETKSGKQAAWLLDRDGKNITVLAVRGWWEHAPAIETAGRDTDTSIPTLNADMIFTDAAWEIIKQCQQIAVSAMEEPAENASEIKVAALK